MRCISEWTCMSLSSNTAITDSVHYVSILRKVATGNGCNESTSKTLRISTILFSTRINASCPPYTSASRIRK